MPKLQEQSRVSNSLTELANILTAGMLVGQLWAVSVAVRKAQHR